VILQASKDVAPFYTRFGAKTNSCSQALWLQLYAANAGTSLLEPAPELRAMAIWIPREDGSRGSEGADGGDDDDGDKAADKDGGGEGANEGGNGGRDKGAKGRDQADGDESRGPSEGRDQADGDESRGPSNTSHLAELYDMCAEAALDKADTDGRRWSEAGNALARALSAGRVEEPYAALPVADATVEEHHEAAAALREEILWQRDCDATTADFPAGAASSTFLGLGSPLRALHSEASQIHEHDEGLRRRTVECAQSTGTTADAYSVAYPAVAGVPSQYSATPISAALRGLLPDLLSAFDEVQDLTEYNSERDVHLLTIGNCHRTGSQQYEEDSGTYAVLKPRIALPDDPSEVLSPSEKAGESGLSLEGLSFLARTMGVQWLQDHISLHNCIYRSAASKNPRLARMGALLTLVVGEMVQGAQGGLLEKEEWADLQAGCPEEQRPFLALPCASRAASHSTSRPALPPIFVRTLH
jgi:hypothetical protein